MSVSLRAVTEADLEKIMCWRMDPDITRFMNTDPVLTLEGQKKWLAAIMGNKDVQYWVILVNGEAAGVLNLNGLENPSGELGWGYYMGEKRLRSLQTALSLEMSMYDYVFFCLGKTAVYSDVFTLNKGVIQLHKLCGCEVVKETKGAVEKNGISYDVTLMRMTAERWRELEPTKKYEKIEF